MLLIDLLLQLPVLVGAAVLMGLTTLVGLAVYRLTYKMLGGSTPREARRSANYLFRVVGILVSLFLSLTFADVMLEMNQIEASIEREAIMIEDIHNDLARYESIRARRAQNLVVDYTRAVIDHDWPALADDRLSREARDAFSQLEYEVLHLEDQSELQGILRSRIIADVDVVSDLRLSRLEQALAKPPLFLVVVIFGYLATMVYFGTQEPSRVIDVLLFPYTLLIGLVIYLILAYSDPFQGATGIDPTPLEFILESMQSE